MYEIIIAGFGGQGVLAAGVVLATAGMEAGLHSTWLPAYGGEQRGGTANCSVKISEEEVGSPFVDHPDVLVAFNQPSLDKFEKTVKPGGRVFVNSSLVSKEVERDDIEVIKVDATRMAADLGNVKAANAIMVGAVIARVPMVTEERAAESLKDYFKGKSEKVVGLNLKAFEKGIEAAGRK